MSGLLRRSRAQVEHQDPHGDRADGVRSQWRQRTLVRVNPVGGEAARALPGSIEVPPRRVEAKGGTFSEGCCPIAVRCPLSPSTAKQAMLSWPRFAAYRNRPEGWMWIWAQVFSPVNPSGSVETVCSGERVPIVRSKR